MIKHRQQLRWRFVRFVTHGCNRVAHFVDLYIELVDRRTQGSRDFVNRPQHVCLNFIDFSMRRRNNFFIQCEHLILNQIHFLAWLSSAEKVVADLPDFVNERGRLCFDHIGRRVHFDGCVLHCGLRLRQGGVHLIKHRNNLLYGGLNLRDGLV